MSGASAWIIAATLMACGTGNEFNDADVDPCIDAECEAGRVCEDGQCVVPQNFDCIDNDGDGYGESCEAGRDCDDTDSAINPARSEVCGDDVDNDCNFIIDDSALCTPCTDTCLVGETFCFDDDIVACDSSGTCTQFTDPLPCPGATACRDGECTTVCDDNDGDGVGVDCEGGQPDDCDDERGDVFPGAPERCDGLDNDCDTIVDEGFVCDEPCDTECTAGDIVCSPNLTSRRICELGPDGCRRLTGNVPCPSGQTCAGGTCTAQPVCLDLDGDGAGPSCDVDDCRPLDPAAFAGATETCNGVDDDCNGIVDDDCDSCAESSPTSPITFGDVAARGFVSCGGATYVQIDSAVGAIVSADSGPPTIASGQADGGAFAATRNGELVGDTQVLHIQSGSPLLQIIAPQGAHVQLALRLDQQCSADNAEPNNSPGASVDVGALPFAHSGGLCESDFDFFRFDAASGRVVAATVLTDPSGSGAVSLTVWRNGVEISPTFTGAFNSNGSPTAATTFFRTDLAGEYTIGLRAPTRNDDSYALLVTQLPRDTCADDAREQDDDDYAGASRLAAGDSVDRMLCPGDYDYHALPGTAVGSNVTIDVTFDDGNLDGYLLSGGIRHIAQVAQTDGSSETFDNSISSESDHALVIFGRTPRDTTSYSIERTR